MDKAETLRAELKKHGFNRNDVGVRMRHYSSLIVEIKKESVPYKLIHDLAMEQKNILYDERAGEILSGSFYVDVRISNELSKEFCNRYATPVQEFLNGDADTVKIDKYLLKKELGFFGVRIISEDYENQDRIVNNACDISEYICKLNMGMAWGTRD